MNSPHVGWAAPADDDDAHAQGSATADPRRGVGGFNTTYRERARLFPRSRNPAQGPDSPGAGPAVSVLADRLAAALVHHEPGWRLPRHSALARRYNVSAAEIDAAVEELVGRHLVRRLADGQLYRASPAEYVIGLAGVPGLVSYVDAMGGEFSCRSRQVTWRLPPEDISWALRLRPDQQVCVVRFLWTAGGEPAALCTTYVPADIAGQPETGPVTNLPSALSLLQVNGLGGSGGNAGGASAGNAGGQVEGGAAGQAGGGDEAPLQAGEPAALHIEMQAPPPSVARSLRLTPGQPAMMVTVRFDHDGTGRPVALAISVLRPDMFRVVVQTPQPPLPDGKAGILSGSWTRAAEDWEP
jgi:DNA-binding GntR family transcriptional regulator